MTRTDTPAPGTGREHRRAGCALKIGQYPVWPPVVLAPMAGITNTSFRSLCREFGAGLYVCEMITTRALVAGDPKTQGDDPVRAGGIPAVGAAVRGRPGGGRARRSGSSSSRTSPITST